LYISLPTIFRVVRVVRRGLCCSPEVVILEGSAFLTVVRVARKGFCYNPEVFGPEESAFCSTDFDEDALIPGQVL
jgi:hypothetical protein